MLIDSLTEFGTAQDLSQVAGTYLFTNQIDLGVANRDLGNGKPLYLCIHVTEAFVGSGATVNFRLRSDDSASIHATTSSGHVETGAIAITALGLGATLCIPLPLNGSVPYERYLGLQAVIATATTTAGACTAYLSESPIGYRAWPDAVN